MRRSENALIVSLHFSQLGPTQNAAPSTRHGDCSTAHQRRLAELPQVLQHRRQVVHRGERHAVLGAHQPLEALQASAPQRLRLRQGAAGHQHLREPRPWSATGAEKFPRLRGERALFWLFVVSWHIFGSKSLVRKRDSGIWIVLISLEQLLQAIIYWCYLMFVVNTVAYCNLRLSLLQLCGISGCKSVVTRQYSSWLNKFNKYMFANVLVSLEGLRSAPAQCLKCKKILRAQSFDCSICTAPQPWSMMMPITWLCLSHGNAVVDHVTNMEDKSSSREWPTVRKIVKVWDGSRLQSEAGYWAAIHGPCFAGSSTICFYAWGWGRSGFLELADFVLNGAGNSSQLIA